MADRIHEINQTTIERFCHATIIAEPSMPSEPRHSNGAIVISLPGYGCRPTTRKRSLAAPRSVDRDEASHFHQSIVDVDVAIQKTQRSLIATPGSRLYVSLSPP